MYIVLNTRPDRFGSNLSWYIMQLVYAHKNKWFIHYHNSPFDESIFFKAIREYTKIYNFELGEKKGSHDHEWQTYIIDINEQDWPGNNMKVCKCIGQDILSYYHKHIYPILKGCLSSYYIEHIDNFKNINIDFKKTIAVHMRLDDVMTRSPYDGIYSTQYYRSKLNNDNIAINLEEEKKYFDDHYFLHIPGSGRHYNPYDCQAPIPEDIVQRYIDLIKQKYPYHDVVIVTSPNGKETVKLPYKVISNNNIDVDLYILSKADVILCSKSLFCFSALYFGQARERFIPMWGHIAGTGLTTKYDKNDTCTYLY